MLMMDQAAEGNREELRRKLRENFDGRIVRKDLTKKINRRTSDLPDMPFIIWPTTC